MIKNYLTIFSIFFLKILLILFVDHQYASEFYIPFLELSISNVSLQPWDEWARITGDFTAFPYGYVMWIVFVPFFFIFDIFGLSSFNELAYFLVLLIFDACILYSLIYLFNKKRNLLVYIYWISPIIFLTTYYLGLNDVIPVSFLFLSLICAKNLKGIYSSFFIVLAISAKLSMVFALPFFLLYFFKKSEKKYFYNFCIFFLLFFLLIVSPQFFSTAFNKMLISTDGLNFFFELSLNLGFQNSFYIIPLIFIGFIYFIWRIKILNFELLSAFIGITFFSIALLSSSSLGWYIWAVPFLTIYQINSDTLSKIISGIFSFLLIIYYFVSENMFQLSNLNLIFDNILRQQNTDLILTIVNTLLYAVGLLLIIRIWRELVSQNRFFIAFKKPFLLGISGDSGSGKDSLEKLITNIFGYNVVTSISGDDYHLWDREKQIWNYMTHLNPAANDLNKFLNDIESARNNTNFYSQTYDHSTGKMLKPRKKEIKEFILVSGLHAFYNNELRSNYDLKIFLNMDDDLRKLFKIKRDVEERGHNFQEVINTIDERKKDSTKFIKSQMKYADIIFEIYPLQKINISKEMTDKIPNLGLKITSKSNVNYNNLIRNLVSISTLNIDTFYSEESELTNISVDGQISSEDIDMIASNLTINELVNFVGGPVKWSGGIDGLIQLFTLMHVDRELLSRVQ